MRVALGECGSGDDDDGVEVLEVRSVLGTTVFEGEGCGGTSDAEAVDAAGNDRV